MSGSVYLDANGFIYTVEHIEPYSSLLAPLWQVAQAAQLTVVTSQLAFLEVMVKPLRNGADVIVAAYWDILLHSPDVQMHPITTAVLDRAAHLRASTNLKTADAIHAATALHRGCTSFVTNDPVFRRVPGLAVTVLDELPHP